MEIVSNLETIKWLLIAILCGVLIIAVSFAVMASFSWMGYGTIKESQRGAVFQKQAQQLLSNSNNRDLIELASERIKYSPQDYLAYWYLGKVQFHQGDFIDAKRNFLKVIELDPTMDYSANQWIDDIDEKLEDGPKLVK